MSITTNSVPPAATICEPLNTLDFMLPPELEASSPPEARGLGRDGVRLLVSFRAGGTGPAGNRVEHTKFREIGRYLHAGDVLAINTSGTMNAALDATRENGERLELHLSTHLPANLWTCELRTPGPKGTAPFFDARAGERLDLPAGGRITLLTPYRAEQDQAPTGFPGAGVRPVRLWVATLELPCPLKTYLERYGFPIRYGYVAERWPAEYYQTVYTTEIGSAEMPSAGRAFTPEIITQLVASGVQIAPLLLHTGVASLETHEPPYEEYYRVPPETARLVNAARMAGRRVIAVGTTVVRALETAADGDGRAHPGEGWTHLVITPERGLRVVDGLLTGFHEPRASHLAMLEALAGREHLAITYAAALREHYLWHEFGDLHLILP